MKLVIGLTTLLFATSVFAAYPININCKGTNANKKSISFNISGIETSDPSTRKTSINVKLNLKANTTKGLVELKDLMVKGSKVKSGTLDMYTLNSEISNNDYTQITIAITNKTGDYNTATLIDTNSQDMETEEYVIACDNKK